MVRLPRTSVSTSAISARNVNEIPACNAGPPELIGNGCIYRRKKKKTDLVNNSHGDLQNVGNVHDGGGGCLKGQTQVVNHHLHSTGLDGGNLDTHGMTRTKSPNVEFARVHRVVREARARRVLPGRFSWLPGTPHLTLLSRWC